MDDDDPVDDPPAEAPAEDPERERELEFVTSLLARGLIADDLEIAEVSATGGPRYDIRELEPADLGELLAQIDAAGAQAVIDRAGQLVVHRNHERRVDTIFDELFGADAGAGDGTPLGGVRGDGEEVASDVLRRVEGLEHRRLEQREGSGRYVTLAVLILIVVAAAAVGVVVYG